MNGAGFLHGYTERVDGHLALKRDERDEKCIFLGERNECTVHEAKPTPCSSYPFLPETIRSRRDWEAEANACEGIGQGEEVPAKEVRGLAIAAEVHREGEESFSPHMASDLLEDVPEALEEEWAGDLFGSVETIFDSEGVRVVERQDASDGLSRRALVFDSSPELDQADVPLDAEGDPEPWNLQGQPSLVLLRAGAHASPHGSDMAVIGAGGFCLPMALAHQRSGGGKVIAVEPSTGVIDAAKACLGATESERLCIRQCRGEELLARVGRGSFGFVGIDASEATAADCLVSPCEGFVQESFLDGPLKASLMQGGVLAVNVVGSRLWLADVAKRLSTSFRHFAIGETSSCAVLYASDSPLEERLSAPSRFEMFGEAGEEDRTRQYGFSIVQ